MSVQLSLRQLRREKGVTMTELSRLSGVSRAYISELESGKARDPSVAVVTSLAKALGVTPAAMIGEPEKLVEVSIPQSLVQAAKDFRIPESDVRDLATIKFRDYQPITPEDWKFLYDALRRSMPPGIGRE